jgi:tungstate transport system permease protein
MLSILWMTFLVSSSAVGIAALLGFPLGMWLGFTNFRGKTVIRLLLHTGMAIPPVIVGLTLYLLLSRSGPLGDWEWLYSPFGMILAQIILILPFVINMTMNAVENVSRDLLFQLKCLGASSRQIRAAVIHEARSGMLLAFAMAIGRSLSEVGAVVMVGGNIEGRTRVLTTAILQETSLGNFSFALILGSILLVMAFLVNSCLFFWQTRNSL